MPREHEQQTGMDYQHTLDSLVSWAAEEPTVRAVVLTGSAAAQSQHPENVNLIGDRLVIPIRDRPAL